MGRCQDAGDGDERHAGKNNCSSLGARKGRRSLNRVAGNAAGDNTEDRCHSIGEFWCQPRRMVLLPNVIVVSSFAELRRLPVDEIKGRSSCSTGLSIKNNCAGVWSRCVWAKYSLSWHRPIVWWVAWSSGCAGSLSGQRRLSTSAHRFDFVRRGRRQGSGSCQLPLRIRLLARLSKQGPVTIRLTLTPKLFLR